MKRSILICAVLLAVFSSMLTSCKKQDIPTTTTTDSLKIGLIAYYPFSSSSADSSGNGNNGIVYNITDTTNRYGLKRSAYYFNGTTSYMRVADNSALRLNATNFTINAWVKLDSYNASFGSSIMCKRSAATSSGWSCLVTGATDTTGVSGGAYFGPGGTGLFGVSARVIPLGKWTMITYAYNQSTQLLYIYVNGALDTFTPKFPTPVSTTTGDIFIGRDYLTSASTGYFLKGAMDDLRIYNRQLTSAQISKLFLAAN